MKNIVLILLSFNILFCACSNSKQEAENHYILAKQYFKLNQFNNALTEIKNVLELDSLHFDAKILEAKIKSSNNLKEEAIDILKTILPYNYKIDTVNYLIGNNYFELARYYTYEEKNDGKRLSAYQDAIDHFNSSISENLEYFSAYILKHHALHNMDNYDEAFVTLNKALKIFPDSMNLICFRGIEKIFLGDLVRAFADLNNSINSGLLDSIDLSTAYRFRGVAFGNQEKWQNGIQALISAIKYNPNDEMAYATRATFYIEIGQVENACSDFRKAADLGMISVYEEIKRYCN